MADNSDLASMLGDGTKNFLEYLRRSGRNLADGGGAAVDWLAGGAKSGAQPTLDLMQPGAADQPFLPTADSGGRLGALASALTGPMTPMAVPKGGMVLGAGPAVRTAGKMLDMSPEIAPFSTFGDFSVAGRDLLRNGERVGTIKLRTESGKTPHVVVDDIDILAKGQGTGTAALQALTDAAHERGMGVGLTSDAMRGKAHQVRLRAYYSNLGFSKTRGAGKVPGVDTEFYRPAPTLEASASPAQANGPNIMSSRAPFPAVPQTEEQKRAAIAELLRNGGA